MMTRLSVSPTSAVMAALSIARVTRYAGSMRRALVYACFIGLLVNCFNSQKFPSLDNITNYSM